MYWIKVLRLIFLLNLISCSNLIDKVFVINDELYDYKNLRPIPHEGYYDPITDSGKWLNYLAINLPYTPIKKIRDEVEKAFNVDLQITENKRGKEAHLTLITPLEYWQLHSHLKMQQINQVFLKRIQSLKFRLKCLARAKIKEQKTYFLVAESEDLINLRKEVHKLFVKNGGDPAAFKPTHYFPHVTVGFNVRDLHEKDHILKSESYCIAKIKDKFSEAEK